MQNESQPKNNNSSIHVSLNLKVVVAVLLLVIAVMLALWKPWAPDVTSNTRTVSVTGTTTIKATPDEFVFSPSYEFKNASQKAALATLSAKSEQIIAKLKTLGVPSSKIKSNSSGYNYYPYYEFNRSTDEYTYTLTLTITVDDQKLVQKVQDYLVTTAPSGPVSPNTRFSQAKQKALESQGRDAATIDARAKADQMASNLGFKIVKVKSVTDNQNRISPIYAMPMAADSGAADREKTTSLAVQPGENDLDYSVSVVYYIK